MGPTSGTRGPRCAHQVGPRRLEVGERIAPATRGLGERLRALYHRGRVARAKLLHPYGSARATRRGHLACEVAHALEEAQCRPSPGVGRRLHEGATTEALQPIERIRLDASDDLLRQGGIERALEGRACDEGVALAVVEQVP